MLFILLPLCLATQCSTCKLASVSFFTRSHHFLSTSMLSGTKCSGIILNFLLVRTGSHFSKEPRGSKVWSQKVLLFPSLLSGHTHGWLALTSPAPSPHVDMLLILLDIYPPHRSHPHRYSPRTNGKRAVDVTDPGKEKHSHAFPQ